MFWNDPNIIDLFNWWRRHKQYVHHMRLKHNIKGNYDGTTRPRCHTSPYYQTWCRVLNPCVAMCAICDLVRVMSTEGFVQPALSIP